MDTPMGKMAKSNAVNREGKLQMAVAGCKLRQPTKHGVPGERNYKSQ
jgi:hypothetical protein